MPRGDGSLTANEKVEIERAAYSIQRKRDVMEEKLTGTWEGITGIGVFACPICAAVVSSDHRMRHAEWHLEGVR